MEIAHSLTFKDIENRYVSRVRAFRYISSLLIKNQVPVVLRPTKWPLQKKLDQVLWRVENLTLQRDAQGKISCTEMMHHSMHFLIAKRFGSKLKGRPYLCLLSECLAACSEFYFLLKALRNRMSTREVHELILLYNRNDRLIFGENAANPTKIRETLRKYMSDPFAAYRAVALEMFSFEKLLYLKLEKRVSRNSYDYPRLIQQIRNFEFGIFFLQYDIPVHVLYSRNYCGAASSRIDRQLVKECITLIQKASDMEEFAKNIANTR